MPFKPACKEVGFAKGSIYGRPGTGKTTLLAMIAIHLSKTYHNCAPVAWLASEKGVDFVLDMFKLEGVPLILNRSRSFLDLRSASRDALQEGACIVCVDSITHFWQELLTQGMAKSGPELKKIGRVKEEWAPFTQDFQDSPIHFLVTGRMGFEWDHSDVEDEEGNVTKELVKGGTKIKAETDFGHEPDLEIQMSAIEDPDFVQYEKVGRRTRKTFKSQMLHVATVKKCRVWALNGKAFTWKDQPAYKPGYYKLVAEAFQPHFASINIGGMHAGAPQTESSAILFQNNSEKSYFEAQQKRIVALETWQTTMELIAGGQTRENIRKRAIIGESITGTRSRTEFERQHLDLLVRAVQILLALEKRIKIDSPATDDDLRKCCSLAENDVDHPGKSGTLLEMMLKKSVESVKLAGDGNAQAVVNLIDHVQSAPF
jgi:hypothetical protein